MKHNIYLAFDFAKRDLKEKYIGTGLGQLWFVLSPLVMIFIYTVIFSDFMKMKMNIIDNSYAYSIYLIPGLLAWTAFSATVMRLNTSFFEKAGLIKKINVPMYTFQLAMVLSELFTLAVSMILGLMFLLLIHQPVGWVFLWLIPLMLIQSIFAYGLGTVFSLFTPFFKDFKELVPIVIQLWFWMTPVIYVKTMIEHKYPLLLKYNPFYYFVEIYQNIFLYAKAPSWQSLLVIILIAFVSLLIAGYLYKKMIAAIKDII
ncbi:ABC transporter permease [Sulfurimonas sp. NW15]|uniref:ABC transporter permease n=1 Tax=Sulfurimonas sp. NW15 TaxID=2922729 RepID=UPI003DA9756B